MALPWHVVQCASFATDNIVEDMQLGIELALAGYRPRFCPAARVTGRLPEGIAAAGAQRTRWEHGHIRTILMTAPALCWQGLRQRRWTLLVLACDVAVPPLALLVLLWSAVTLIAAICWVTGGSVVPLSVLAASGTTLAVSILASWAVFGRRLMPAGALLAIPGYLLWKLPLYMAFLFKRQYEWVRTERTP